MAVSAGGRHHWLVSYDISADRTRGILAVDLAARGVRLAYSLFDVSESTTDLVALLSATDERLELGDHVFALRWCDRCEGSIAGEALAELRHVVVAPPDDEEEVDDEGFVG